MLISLNRMVKRRLEKFHKNCISQCSSPKAFSRAFEVNQSHVSFRAAQTVSHLRISLMCHERLASVISGGILNLDRSVDGHPIQIAIEAHFKNFEWTDPAQTKGVPTGVEPVVCVRVVVKESKPKNFIVTVYPILDADSSTMPEVSYEFWT